MPRGTLWRPENQFSSCSWPLRSCQQEVDRVPPHSVSLLLTLWLHPCLFWTSRKKESVLFICSSYMARSMCRGHWGHQGAIWRPRKKQKRENLKCFNILLITWTQKSDKTIIFTVTTSYNLRTSHQFNLTTSQLHAYKIISSKNIDYKTHYYYKSKGKSLVLKSMFLVVYFLLVP